MKKLNNKLNKSLETPLLRRLMLRNLLIAGLVLIGCVQCSAQTINGSTVASSSTSASSQDSEILKLLEITKIQLEAEKEKNKLKDAQLGAKDVQIEAYKGLVAVRDEQITLLRSANADRAAVNTGDARMLASCENILAKTEAELHRLRYPGLLRSLFDMKTITGGAVGFGIGRLSK